MEWLAVTKRWINGKSTCPNYNTIKNRIQVGRMSLKVGMNNSLFSHCAHAMLW